MDLEGREGVGWGVGGKEGGKQSVEFRFYDVDHLLVTLEEDSIRVGRGSLLGGSVKLVRADVVLAKKKF